MNSSSPSSDSKCISDFSIRRILGDTGDSVREDDPAPSWLCCTRYQPPRLPRAVSNSTCRSRRSGRHARVPFTTTQAAALEAAYSRAPYLAPPALRALAAALQLRDDRIKIWFQNRRARERREKCSNITPPQAVTLPPTTSQICVLPNRPWSSNPHISVIDKDEIVKLEVDENILLSQNETAKEINVVRPCTTVQSADDCEQNRCDSPLDIET